MAILAGMDEAGYGPHLGPLVVSAAVVRLPGDALPDPTLWSALRSHVRKRPRGSSSRVVVCDSKAAYAASGVGALERAVLGFLAASGRRPTTLSALVRQTRPSCDGAAEGDLAANVTSADATENGPWHAPEDLRLPAAVAAEDVASAADHLERGLARLGGRCERLYVNVAPAARFNRLVGTTGNKAGALFAMAAELLIAIHRRWPDETIHVTMDRHGGRRYYADLLAQAFPMERVETLDESPHRSAYRLLRSGAGPGPAEMRLTICERCEEWSLVAALASMAAKYVRELHMRQLNAYFQRLVPGLRPTAGYGRDAWRFLADVDSVRRAHGVTDAVLLRCR